MIVDVKRPEGISSKLSNNLLPIPPGLFLFPPRPSFYGAYLSPRLSWSRGRSGYFAAETSKKPPVRWFLFVVYVSLPNVMFAGDLFEGGLFFFGQFLLPCFGKADEVSVWEHQECASSGLEVFGGVFPRVYQHLFQ